MFNLTSAFITATMVVLPVDANGNPLIWFIESIPLEDFRHVSHALIFPSFTSRNHQAFFATYQSKFTLPVPPYYIIVLNVPPTVNQYMLIAPYSNTDIFLLILGGCLLPPPLLFIHWFQPSFPLYQLLHLFNKFSSAPTLDLSLSSPPQPCYSQIQQNTYTCTSV